MLELHLAPRLLMSQAIKRDHQMVSAVASSPLVVAQVTAPDGTTFLLTRGSTLLGAPEKLRSEAASRETLPGPKNTAARPARVEACAQRRPVAPQVLSLGTTP